MERLYKVWCESRKLGCSPAGALEVARLTIELDLDADIED